MCLFTTLTTFVQCWILSRCCVIFFFFYSFQGHNLLIVDQNFKRGGNVKNREDQISMGQSLCINKNVCRFGFVPVIPVSPDATLKERCLGQSQ